VSRSVVCSGCGARLEVADDYARKKLRCSQCGVIFELPEPDTANAPPRKAAPAKPTSPPKPAKSNPTPAVAVPVPPVHVTEPERTPVTAIQAPPSPAPPKPAELPEDEDDEEFAFADDPQAKPYEKTVSEIRECPHCHATVNPEARSCGACGFLLVTKSHVTLHQPVKHRWESGWSYRRRLTLFLICQGGVWALMIGAIIVGLSPFIFIFPYALFTGMTAFLLGSYNWVDLNRNKRGKLRLTQTWRICFLAQPATILHIRDYEELATGVEHQFDTTDWIMLLFLALFGILPGLWWWFYVGSRDTYFISLCRDHGYPVVTLYRGWNREHMEDMAETIAQVAGLPLRR
jgi:hypothetical protein